MVKSFPAIIYRDKNYKYTPPPPVYLYEKNQIYIAYTDYRIGTRGIHAAAEALEKTLCSRN